MKNRVRTRSGSDGIKERRDAITKCLLIRSLALQVLTPSNFIPSIPVDSVRALSVLSRRCSAHS